MSVCSKSMRYRNLGSKAFHAPSHSTNLSGKESGDTQDEKKYSVWAKNTLSDCLLQGTIYKGL